MGVNGWARRVALTPFVPLSREAGEGERAAGRTAVRPYTPSPARGEGDYGVRKRSFRPAEADASALQTGLRAAHPSPTLWERSRG